MLLVLILLVVKDCKKAVQKTMILKTMTLHFRKLVLKTAKLFPCCQTFIGFALFYYVFLNLNFTGNDLMMPFVS